MVRVALKKLALGKQKPGVGLLCRCYTVCSVCVAMLHATVQLASIWEVRVSFVVSLDSRWCTCM
jgi:hypothetical protein